MHGYGGSSITTYNAERKCLVRVLNPSQKHAVSGGTVIGCFTGIEPEQLVKEEHGQNVVQVDYTHADMQGKQASTVAVPQAIAPLSNSYSNVFSGNERDVGLTNTVQHSIPGEPHLRAEKDAEVQKQVQKLYQQGLIEPARGAWSSPDVLVKKKDDSWKFSIDYRCLNAITLQDAYSLPRIDKSLDALSSSQYFSTLNLLSGYW